MNGIILYGSQYGAALQYAQALEVRTGLPALSYDQVKGLGDYDTIVYIGSLYAGKTTGLAKTLPKLPTDHPFRLLVATVGLADPDNEDSLTPIRKALMKELSPGVFTRTTHVHLRGAIDYQVLSLKHRMMMKGLCTVLRRQSQAERSPENQMILDSYGKAVDFIDFDALKPILDWLEQ